MKIEEEEKEKYVSDKHKIIVKQFDHIKDKEHKQELYNFFVESYSDHIIKMDMRAVLIRNMCFIILILTTIALALNFTIDNQIYRLYYLITSFLLVYYFAHYLYIILNLILNPPLIQKNEPIPLIILFILEFIIFILYIVFSFNSTFYDYFKIVNSIYSDTTITIFILCIMAMIIFLAIYRVKREIDSYIKDFTLKNRILK